MFNFRIVKAPNGTLHVLRPYAQHFSRQGDPNRLGRAGYCLDPRSGRMLYGY